MSGLTRRQILLAGLALPLAGCGNDFSDSFEESLPKRLGAGGLAALVEQARREGSLMVYGAPSQDKFGRWTVLFEREFGIPVEYYRGPSNSVYQRFVQEQRAGRRLADIISISDLNVIRDGVRKGMISRYTPQTASLFPQAARLDAAAYPLFVSLSPVAWNTRIVPPDLQAALSADPLRAILDPRLMDRIVLVDIAAGGPQLATSANLTNRGARQYGWDYLRRIAAQRPAIVRTSPVILDRVIAGDAWVALDGYDSIFAPAAVAGAPIAFSYPDPVAAAPFYVSVARHAAHPFAARLFSEWSTSIAAQNSLAMITNTQVLIRGFEDRRVIRSMPWYRPPHALYLEWQQDPQLRDEELHDYFRRWRATMEG
jgi:ABC-type Fe3+ transport system substrate-binding protein